VKLTLSAWLTRWEQELWRCVLTPEEKTQNYLWRHNLNALLRGDFPSRMTGYATMLQNGIACQDEIRDLEDWNAIEDGIGAAITSSSICRRCRGRRTASTAKGPGKDPPETDPSAPDPSNRNRRSLGDPKPTKTPSVTLRPPKTQEGKSHDAKSLLRMTIKSVAPDGSFTGSLAVYNNVDSAAT